MAANNPYIFGDPATDRQRLETQTALFSNYIRDNGRRFLGSHIQHILDVGCGEGQLGRVLRDLYGPQTHLVGIDKDERAIVQARTRAQELGLTNVEYIVGDVSESLPPGPFDLVYISMVLMHMREPPKLVQAAYNVLKPGGYVWIKDLHPDWMTAMNHRSFQKLADLVLSAMEAIGSHPFIGRETPEVLRAAGFIEIREEIESYLLGGATPEGQAMLAAQLGVFHNARSVMSRVRKVPESEIERLYIDVCNAALRSDKELGQEPLLNVIARRPFA